jgi:hypothetical protein
MNDSELRKTKEDLSNLRKAQWNLIENRDGVLVYSDSNGALNLSKYSSLTKILSDLWC